jgi:hypothetical protein
MMLYKTLNERHDHDYYKIEGNGNLINIQKEEYNIINKLIRGGEAISIKQLELKIPVIKMVFRHEFIYDFLLPMLDEYNKEIEKKIKGDDNINYNNMNLYISGGTSLIINLEEYKSKFTNDELELYDTLFEKSDIDASIIINIDNENDKKYKDIIRLIAQRLLYKYKEILLNNNMFIYYIKHYVTDYLNSNNEFKTTYNVKNISKKKLSNKIKYENKGYVSKWSITDDLPDDIFIRINENFKPMHDLYRLMLRYDLMLNDNNIVNMWVELIDISITEITIKPNEIELIKIHKIIKNIKNIFNENLRLKKETTIDDIPKINEQYDICKILWILAKDNDVYITKKEYNNLYINVLTIEGYIYESILIILNTPEDLKTNKRIKRLVFLLTLQYKH